MISSVALSSSPSLSLLISFYSYSRYSTVEDTSLSMCKVEESIVRLAQCKHRQPSEHFSPLFLQLQRVVWLPVLHLQPFISCDTRLWIDAMLESLSQSMPNHPSAVSFIHMKLFLSDGLCLVSLAPHFNNPARSLPVVPQSIN